MNNLMINGYWTPQSGFANCRLWSALRQPNVEPYGHFLTSLIWHIGMSSYPVCHAWTMVLLRSSVVRTCPKCMYVWGYATSSCLFFNDSTRDPATFKHSSQKKHIQTKKNSNHLWYKPFRFTSQKTGTNFAPSDVQTCFGNGCPSWCILAIHRPGRPRRLCETSQG